jgi:hypothetical protein
VVKALRPLTILRCASVVLLAACASSALGACDYILEAASPDRHVDPHVDCSGASCVCTGGFAHCVGGVDNGCETDLTTDAENCGACGVVCAESTHGTCVSGACVCAAGFVDCDGSGCGTPVASLAVDPKNCGDCGHDCGIGSCAAGLCQPFTLGTAPSAVTLAAFAGSVDVGTCNATGPAIVGFIPGVGGSMPAVLDSGCVLALSGSSVQLVWASSSAIVLVPFGVPAMGTQIASSVSPSGLLAAGPTSAYWWDTPAAPAAHALMRVAFAGGAPETIATAELLALTADDEAAYWSDAAGVHSVQHGATAVTDMTGPQGATALASDGVTLFAAIAAQIQAIPLGSGLPTLVAASTQVQGMVADGGDVFWSDPSDGSLRRASSAGGPVTVLVSGEVLVPGSPITVDRQSVYWLAKMSQGLAVRGVAR